MNADMLKKDIKYLLKNPVFYFGVVVVIYILIITIGPYLDLYKNTIDITQKTIYGEHDLVDGYIPTPEKEKKEQVLKNIQKSLIEDYNLTSSDAENVVQQLEKMDTQEEVKDYLGKNYDMPGIDSAYRLYRCKKATRSEMEDYLNSVFSQKSYTESLSYKFIDYLGVGLVYFSIIVFMFIFMRDMKRDIYSLVHTKPISSFLYIFTKLFAGLVPLYTFAIVVTAIFDIIVNSVAVKYNFACEWISVWIKLLLLILPNVFMIGVFFVFITMLFKNILPTIPALLVYATYSNMGKSSEDGFIYTPNPLAIIVRFPNDLADNYIPTWTVINQVVLVVLAVCLLWISIRLWEKKKMI